MLQLQQYLNSKKLAWSPTTYRSTEVRLKTLLGLKFNTLEELYNILNKQYKPYTTKQFFIQYAAFKAFFKDYTVQEWVKEHALLFKNAYETEQIDITFNDAKDRVAAIKDGAIRTVALSILQSGMRAHEALKYDGSGSVVGKGKKRRTIFIDADLSKYGISYDKLYTELKKVGLKPHTLRKLAATKLAEVGFKEADLMKVMGWNSIITAGRYLQSARDQELKQKIQEALG